MAYNYEWPYTDPNRYNDDWLLKTMQDVLAKVDALDNWKETHEAEYLTLKRLYDQLSSGNFPPAFQDALVNWMQANVLDIVGDFVKSIFFEVDDSGYLVAYIPESWQDITFNTTGYDIEIAGVDFGHLTLSY